MPYLVRGGNVNSYTQQWSFNHKGSLEWFLALRPPPIRRPASFREPWCVSTANMKETLHKSAPLSGGRRNQQHRSQNRHSGPTQRLKEQPQPREKVQQVQPVLESPPASWGSVDLDRVASCTTVGSEEASNVEQTRKMWRGQGGQN